MKSTISTGIAAAAILFTGCGKKNGSSGSSGKPPTAQADEHYHHSPFYNQR
jgi:hypothetical protein